MDSTPGNIYYTLTKDDPLWFTERNSLDFRFFKDAEDGVLFYMGRDADHLLVELVNGSLRVQADFGGGKKKLCDQMGTSIQSFEFSNFQFVCKLCILLINPLRPNSDPFQTSHCNIKGLLVSEVMRIENMITQVKFY